MGFFDMLIFAFLSSIVLFILFHLIRAMNRASMEDSIKDLPFEEQNRRRAQWDENIRSAEAELMHGNLNYNMICPHCNSKGTVRTKHVTQKKGISGGKATAAIITGGLSVLATGLSRKEGATQARCDNCNNTWFF